MKAIAGLHLTLLSLFAFCYGNRQVERKIQIINDTGHRVEIFWIHPYTEELVLQTTPHIFAGNTFDLNSFVGHTFQANELPGSKSGKCKEQECKTTYFTVSENENQVFSLEEGMIMVPQDNKSIARDEAVNLLSDCKDFAIDQLYADPGNAERSIENLVKCAEKKVASMVEKSNEEVDFQASVRTRMGDLLENYTCADDDLDTTEPEEEKDWTYKGKTYKVKVMHERSSSKIHVIENFISPEECKAVEEAASHKLHRATVADSDGGSRFSESRKAMQAGIAVPWNRELFGNPIAAVSRRVLDYTNTVTNYKLAEHGQEDLMSIQYTGRGKDDPEPDRYMPHCDGDCLGRPHRNGTRVATVVMYCDVPEVGGATNFRNAGVHIVAKSGNAVFFSYMGDDGIMDKGFTEHSGCPVLEGKKTIVTQWMRKGVDKENPWDSWNTMGIKYDEALDQ